MKILWVPHTSFQAGVRPRSDYFIECLKVHHTIHTLAWDVPIRRSLGGLISTLSLSTKVHEGVVVHHMPRVQFPFNGDPPFLTQAVFRWMLRRIVRQEAIDVVVCACNWYALGYPPADLPVPLVIDYFDLLEDRDERQYLLNCDAVLCSSTVLFDRAERFSAKRYYLPNAIDASLFREADGRPVRVRYGLNGARVVSLIGLTSSPTLYFMDAVELAAQRRPDIKCLIVGSTEQLPRIRDRVSANPGLFLVVDSVPYSEIPALFASSDVGMYPGDAVPHFHAALPIKVLEYTAAGKPVVAPPLDELKRLNFPNIVFADASPESFAQGICTALDKRVAPSADLRPFDVHELSRKLEGILREVVTAHESN